MTRISPLLAAGLCLALPAHAQIPYRESGLTSKAQRTLPAFGPGSAHSDPAALAETRNAYVTFGYLITSSGAGGGVRYWEASAGHAAGPVSLAAGLGGYGNGSAIDGSNALYTEGGYTPGIAIAFPQDPDRHFRIAFGLAAPILRINAFNAIKATSFGLDYSLSAALQGAGGRFGLDFAQHYLRRPRAALPDGGFYLLPGWMTQGFAWESAGKAFRCRMELYLDASREPAEGPSSEDPVGMNGWEIEFRPLPLIGLKAERTRIGSMSSLGLVAHPTLPWNHLEGFIEINIGHDKYDPNRIPIPFHTFIFGEEGKDEGRGLVLALSSGFGF